MYVRDELRAHPRTGKDDRLHARLQQARGDPLALQDHAPADPLDAVHERRVVQDEVPLAGGGAVLVDERRLLLEDPAGQLVRVADRGRAADEYRRGAVEPRDPLQAPDDAGHVGAENAPVGVHLVDDDVLQMRQRLDPLGVIGKDSRVQHVGIRDDDPSLVSGRDADRARRVPVVREDPDRDIPAEYDLVQLGLLVLGERFRGEQVQGPRIRVLQERLQDGEVVREGLARGRGADEDDAPARAHLVPGSLLVAVDSVDPAGFQGRTDPGVHARGDLDVGPVPRRHHFPVGHPLAELRVISQRPDDIGHESLDEHPPPPDHSTTTAGTGQSGERGGPGRDTMEGRRAR